MMGPRCWEIKRRAWVIACALPVPELCREHGMSSASLYKWRANGGMDASLISQSER